MPVTPPAPVILCTDLEKITFASFLKCLCDNNLAVLVESGLPNAHQLFLAWITVLSGYYSLIKSREQVKYIKLVARIEGLNMKITVVSALCDALRTWYEPKLCDCLKTWGYNFPFTPESLLSDLNKVSKMLENENFKLEKARLEFNATQNVRKKKGEIPTKEAYMKMLYAIERHRQYRYPPDKISVYEFGMWYNELVEYNEMMTNENEKLTSKSYRNAK